MAQPSCLNALQELHNPASSESRIAALKLLKNELIGHREKKEELVRQGIVDALAHTLLSSAKSRGKRKDQGLNGAFESHAAPSIGAGEDEERLQAILLLSSLAHEGPSFVAPILAGSTVAILVAALSPTENSPRIVISSLRTLLHLAEADRLAGPRSESLQKSPAMDALYSKATVQLFAEILLQRSSSTAVHSQVSLLCQLISKTCMADRQRDLLVASGILDLLAARLASYHAHQRICHVRIHPSLAAALPSPPPYLALPHILEAIIQILTQSRYRVARLLYSPSIISLFPFHKPEAIHEYSSSLHLQSSSGLVSPIEHSLPQIPHTFHKSENGFTRAFPALSAFPQSAKHAASVDFLENSPYPFEGTVQSNGVESSFVSWLFYTIRTEPGLLRLQAAHLLAIINIAGFLIKCRDRMIAFLVVPLLLGMMDDKPPARQVPLGVLTPQLEAWVMKEQAPVILTKLLGKSSSLQKAAVEAGAVKRVSHMLKQSFEPLDHKTATWTPSSSATSPSGEVSPSSKLGMEGLRPDLVHLFRCRTGALLLLAAIADRDEKYKKQLTENGVISCIIDSLTPFNEEMLAAMDVNGNTSKIQSAALGNSINILLAACGAARALSRSVGLLRTSLIDGGLAKPIYALLKHPNVAVVTAATDVVCNIITDFSPMREDLLEAGAIKTLCEHAHSADSTIRLVSLWALKHLMLKSPNDVKLQCFEELGSGWLVQIITGGANTTRLSKSSLPLTMGAANAAGERIDILNAVDEPMDVTEDGGSGDACTGNLPPADDLMLDDSIMTLLFPNNDTDFSTFATECRTRLRSIKDAEDRLTTSQAYADELKIQSQGLDIVRNMISPPKPEDMIDTLFQTLGANTIFEMVGSKLKPPPATAPATLATHLATTDALTTSQSLTAELDASHSLVEAAVNILVHIGASAPRHRQQLISQPALLRALLPLLSHPDSAIRTACVWVAINLTWVDDASDAGAARMRAMELRKLGWEDKLVELRGDEDRDCRERVTTAVEQMRELLGEGGGRVGGVRGGS